MHQKRGLTIVEMLIAIAIVLLVAAIAFPLTLQVKQKASLSNSSSNLRQIGIALNLYRNSYDGDGRYGHWTYMGMPPYVGTLVESGFLDSGNLACTGSPIPTNPERERYHAASWRAEDWKHLEVEGFRLEYWGPYTERYKDEAICVYDLHHPLDGFAGVPYSPMDSQRAIGLRLDGSVTVRVRAGDSERRSWWHDDLL